MAAHCSSVLTCDSVSVGHCVDARDVKLFKSFVDSILAPHLCTPQPLQTLVLWGAPQMLDNVTDSQGELTEEVLFSVSHLLPSLLLDWCQWLERSKLRDTSYPKRSLDAAVGGLRKTLVSACLLSARAVLACFTAVQPRLQRLPGLQKACSARQSFAGLAENSRHSARLTAVLQVPRKTLSHTVSAT